jgi:N-acylneuraminate cytidylyltransferase
VKTIGIITARGGSKGIKGKNLREVAGLPLIHWTVKAALSASTLDRVVLSSDDEAIMDSARAAGCEIPFRRPAELAGDNVPTLDVILHALDEIPGFEVAVVLQPTSPMREAADIDACVKRVADEGRPACCAVSRVHKSPNWMFTMDSSGELDRYLKDEPMALQRQKLAELYAPNGAVYAVRTDFLRAERSFLAPGTVGVIMPERRSVDVDDEFDLEICDYLLRKRENKR